MTKHQKWRGEGDEEWPIDRGGHQRLCYATVTNGSKNSCIVYFFRKILGVVTVGRIIARIVGGDVTTDGCISEITYKSFNKVNNY